MHLLHRTQVPRSFTRGLSPGERSIDIMHLYTELTRPDVIALQIVLLILILLMLGPGGPKTEKSHSLQELKHSAGSQEQYSVVLDAGSTGSRVHVFRFDMEHRQLKLISDTFEQLKPGKAMSMCVCLHSPDVATDVKASVLTRTTPLLLLPL
jgi:hypothetical protein